MRFVYHLRFFHNTQNLSNILVCNKRKLEKICLVDKDTVDPCTASPKVVIIGAGMAGLSAAARLVKAGITDVTVLEATERPGGRIHSCRLANTTAEIGAQWIYGAALSNTAMTLAAQESLLDPQNMYKHNTISPNAVFMTNKGRAVNRTIAMRASSLFKQIENSAYTLHKRHCGKEHGSLMNYFSLAIEQELQNFPENHRKNAAKIMYSLINTVSNNWGGEIDKMSADLFGSYTRISNDTVGIPMGMVGMIAPLLRVIPTQQILYNKVVNKIQWSKVCKDNKPVARVAVKCCDGSEYHADYAVSTVSLGVLKREAQKLFTPSLPTGKMEAINKLGYGNTCKIFMEYDRPFWVWGDGNINLAWSINDLKEKGKWVTGISHFEEVPGSQQLLMAAVSGEKAEVAEAASDQKVAEEITTLLRKFTGDPTIPYPVSIVKSQWKKSPYFMGSCTYFSINSTLGHQSDLAAPVPVTEGTLDTHCIPPIAPILLFAGEATCPNYYSTVHGARLSGLRVAKEIIDLTKLYSGPPPLPGQLPKEPID